MPSSQNPSEKAAANSTDLRSFVFSLPRQTCLAKASLDILAISPPPTQLQKTTLGQIDRKVWEVQFEERSPATYWREGVVFGPSLSEARTASFDHSLRVARFRSCSHQPPFIRARDLSGGPSAAFPAGIVCCSFPALLKSCSRGSTPPPYVRLTLSHYQSSLASLSIKVICLCSTSCFEALRPGIHHPGAQLQPSMCTSAFPQHPSNGL